MNPLEYKLVLVVWVDAESNDSWVKLKDVIHDEPMECASVGWLVADKPDRLIIVASMDLDNDEATVSGHVSIPRQQVKTVTELTTKKARKVRALKVKVEQPVVE